MQNYVKKNNFGAEINKINSIRKVNLIQSKKTAKVHKLTSFLQIEDGQLTYPEKPRTYFQSPCRASNRLAAIIEFCAVLVISLNLLFFFGMQTERLYY